MSKNRKKCPFFPLNKAKKWHAIGGPEDPKKGSFGPKNRRFLPFLANFGHFAGKLRQKQAPQKGQKRSILTPFCQKARGVPGFWQKTAPNNGNLSGHFSCFARKRGVKTGVWGGSPPKSTKKRSFYMKFDRKRVLSSNKHKEIAFAPY